MFATKSVSVTLATSRPSPEIVSFGKKPLPEFLLPFKLKDKSFGCGLN
jgi:hypothetical protein